MKYITLTNRTGGPFYANTAYILTWNENTQSGEGSWLALLGEDNAVAVLETPNQIARLIDAAEDQWRNR